MQETTMETVRPKTRQGLLQRFSSLVVRGWTAVVTIGVTAEMPIRERKRIRLLNGICFMSMMILFLFCMLYSAPQYRLTFWESLQGVVANLFVLFLNRQKKYNAACHFFLFVQHCQLCIPGSFARAS